MGRKHTQTHSTTLFLLLKKNQNGPIDLLSIPQSGGKKYLKVYVGSKAANTKPLHDIQTGSPMEITLGQQYNVGEKPTVILYAYINRLVVCVCVFSSHPFWTSSSLDVPAGVTQEEGHTGFLIHLPSAVRALIFVARRIQPFLSLVDREVEFCVLTN